MSQLSQVRPATYRGKAAAGSGVRFVRRALLYVAFLLITFLVVLPLVWVVITSLKTQDEYLHPAFRIMPEVLQWRNYSEALFEHSFLFFRKTANTLLIALPTMIMTVISSSLTGFGFARHRAPLRNALFILVLAMMMVPAMVTIIPQFILYSKLGLTNTYWPWYLQAVAGAPFNIFLFRQFFSTIPEELEEAAEIDGSSRFRIYWQIFMPNALPAIAVVSIFHFQWAWGDWFTPRIYLNEEKSTLAILLTRGFANPKGYARDAVTLAAVVVYMLPLIIMFMFAQKLILEGIVTTGIKG